MKRICLFFALFIVATCPAQSTYFPPAGNNWQTVSPQSLGWCQDRIDTLLNYLQLKNTKGFIILKDGKIALEQYYGTFTQDSLWYWASAGKTMTAFLTGKAQEEGFLSIEDSTAKYLGDWTNAPAQQEAAIKIRHQLTMTTGLDYNVPDLDCTTPTCLSYLADPGTLWYYYNAPYRLINDVIEAATGTNYNIYTTTKVKTPIGMGSGIWVQDVFYSKLRDAARFGHLILNKGKWNGTAIMQDTAYFYDMTHRSQDLNKSYGYLWWLNGQGEYKLPQSTFTFTGDLVTEAPVDMIAGLGKYDQKIYVVPSLNMVVVRLGSEANEPAFGPSSFDNDIWARVMNLECTNGVDENPTGLIKIFPNPAGNELTVNLPLNQNNTIEIYTSTGQLVYTKTVASPTHTINVSSFAPGIYITVIKTPAGIVISRAKVVKE